jgi:phage gpG-like protein
MIDAAIDNADAVVDGLADLAAKADAALAAAAQDLAGRLLALAAENLSGSVLKARTGTLRDSLSASVDVSGADIRAIVGSSAPYAAFQEYGFTGVESVRAHLRRQTVAFGRAIAPVQVAVRPYDRRVDYPAHSFLRSALADMSQDIESGLSDALAEAFAS